MDAGRLSEFLTIQRADIAADGYGQPIKTWRPSFFTWGCIETLAGNSTLADRLIQSEASHRVTVRWAQEMDLRVTDRLFWGDDRILEIVSVADTDQRHEWLVLLCKEATT
jgi:SPP1 family predicted phage head-tail adaptor